MRCICLDWNALPFGRASTSIPACTCVSNGPRSVPGRAARLSAVMVVVLYHTSCTREDLASRQEDGRIRQAVLKTRPRAISCQRGLHKLSRPRQIALSRTQHACLPNQARRHQVSNANVYFSPRPAAHRLQHLRLCCGHESLLGACSRRELELWPTNSEQCTPA